MRNEQFWKEHIRVYNYIKEHYQDPGISDFALSNAIKGYFEVEIDPEKIRWLRRSKGWKKRVSTDGESGRRGETFERHVFMGDLEIPFHDEKLLALFLVFLKHFKPHRLWIIGDFLAWYQVSTWKKDPRLVIDLQRNIDTGNKVLDALYKMVDKIEFFGGNHEFRMIQYLRSHPEVHSLRELQVASLLKLHERGIKYHPWKQAPLKYHSLQIHHGCLVRKHSGWTAKGHWEKFGGNGIVGHCHRMGSYVKRTTDGVWGWWENGCMRSLKADYGGFFDWIQGWSVAYFTKKDLFHLEQVPVIKHKFLFQGKLFSAKEK